MTNLPRHRMTWTRAEDRKLFDTFLSPVKATSAEALSAEFGRTKHAVAARLLRLGLLVEVADGYHRIGPIWATWEELKP